MKKLLQLNISGGSSSSSNGNIPPIIIPFLSSYPLLLGGGGSFSQQNPIQYNTTYNTIGYGGNGVGGAYQNGGSINPTLSNGASSITSYGNGGGSVEVTTNDILSSSSTNLTASYPFSPVLSNPPPSITGETQATTYNLVTTTTNITTITYNPLTVENPLTDVYYPYCTKTTTNSSLVVTQTLGLGAPGVVMLCWLDWKTQNCVLYLNSQNEKITYFSPKHDI